MLRIKAKEIMDKQRSIAQCNRNVSFLCWGTGKMGGDDVSSWVLGDSC